MKDPSKSPTARRGLRDHDHVLALASRSGDYNRPRPSRHPRCERPYGSSEASLALETSASSRSLTVRSSSADWTPGSHVDLMLPANTSSSTPSAVIGTTRPPTRSPSTRADGRSGSAYVHDRFVVDDVVGSMTTRRLQLTPAPHYLFVAAGSASARSSRSSPPSRWARRQSAVRRPVPFSMAYLEEPRSTATAYRPYHKTSSLLDLADAVAVFPTGPACTAATYTVLATIAEPRPAAADALRVERFVAQQPPAPVRTRHRGQAASSGRRHGPTPRRSSTHCRSPAYRADLLPQGICGTYENGVVAGEPDHRDSLRPGRAAANESKFVCVSRSCSDRLVLDL